MLSSVKTISLSSPRGDKQTGCFLKYLHAMREKSSEKSHRREGHRSCLGRITTCCKVTNWGLHKTQRLAGKNFLFVRLSLPCRRVMIESRIPHLRDNLQLTPALPANIPLLLGHLRLLSNLRPAFPHPVCCQHQTSYIFESLSLPLSN